MIYFSFPFLKKTIETKKAPPAFLFQFLQMVFYYESNDHVVYAGRDKYENEILLKNCFDDVDVWFHCDQISSAHVYLRLKSGESIETIDESILMDCCQLVKHCSIEGNKMRKVDVVYTLASNLRKTRAMDVGQVSFRDEKLVHRFKKIRDGRGTQPRFVFM